MQETLNNNPKVLENQEKAKLINKYWDDSNFKIQIGGESLTLRECYERQIAYSDKVFESTKKLSAEIIPEGKYILFINSAQGGTADHPEIGLVAKERIEMMYRMETGSDEINEESKAKFQENNMRRCLGLEPRDQRLRAINAYNEEIPKDLSNCVGVVFSGSKADVLDEEDGENIAMRESVREFMLHTHEKEIDVPKFGICFGGQLSAEVYADAKIGYVKDMQGEKTRTQGVNEIYKTRTGKYFSFWDELPHTIYVPQDHGQEIERKTVESMHAEVLAENTNGGVEVLYLKEAEALCTQFHPEAGSIRMDISESLYGNKIPPNVLFENDTDKVREVFFTLFIKTIGRYLEGLEKKN